MKLLRIFFAAALAWLPSNTFSAAIAVGSGPDSSFFLIESPNVGQRLYEVSYTHDSENPFDGFFLFESLLNADPELDAIVNNFGTEEAPNIFLDTITFNSVSESNDFSSGLFWAHWVAGGQVGQTQSLGGPVDSFLDVPDQEWTFGSGVSAPFRFIEPGSYDAFTFDSDSNPSFVIPEPSSLALLLPSGLLLLRRRR
ncbi:MAG: hypothetical protein AAF555_06780 [Verrucomicrobiota bacterium]